VKNAWAHPWFLGRCGLAVIAGLLWTCAFPKVSVAGCAWIAPGLMLGAALGTRGGEAFRIGYTAGLAHYLSLLYWLLLIPYRWQGIPLGPALGWLALSGFVALFPGAWVWLMAEMAYSARARGDGSPPGASGSAGESFPFVGLASALAPTWLGRSLWMLCGGALWVAWEMILARVFGGFPWSPLGASQYPILPLIQMASATGVYGLSFVAVWVSLALLSAAMMMILRPGARSVWLAEVCVPVLAVAGLFNLGLRELRNESVAERTLKVMLVQPSIPQALIWDLSQDTNRFNQLVQYSDQVLTNKADLLIWPESGVPRMVRYDTNTFAAISGLARHHQVWMIVGSDDMEPRRGAADPEAVDYFNSSFLVNPEGRLAARYIKRQMVIFGEYVPLQRWLPFLGWFTPVGTGFTAGTGPAGFDLEGLGVKTSVQICYEDIFPHLVRTDVAPDTDFLVNITNDGWFGNSAEQWQHATAALFRAVENRVPLIRCCNNGLSCWIDGHGRLREVLRDPEGTVYGMGYLRAEIPILSDGARHPLTFYTRKGDVFGWSCAGLSAVILATKVRVSRRPPADREGSGGK
jgi:apolipoprotein N-acyltransferase